LTSELLYICAAILFCCIPSADEQVANRRADKAEAETKEKQAEIDKLQAELNEKDAHAKELEKENDETKKKLAEAEATPTSPV